MSIASDKLIKECEEKMLKTIEAVKEKLQKLNKKIEDLIEKVK